MGKSFLSWLQFETSLRQDCLLLGNPPHMRAVQENKENPPMYGLQELHNGPQEPRSLKAGAGQHVAPEGWTPCHPHCHGSRAQTVHEGPGDAGERGVIR